MKAIDTETWELHRHLDIHARVLAQCIMSRVINVIRELTPGHSEAEEEAIRQRERDLHEEIFLACGNGLMAQAATIKALIDKVVEFNCITVRSHQVRLRDSGALDPSDLIDPVGMTPEQAKVQADISLWLYGEMWPSIQGLMRAYRSELERRELAHR